MFSIPFVDIVYVILRLRFYAFIHIGTDQQFGDSFPVVTIYYGLGKDRKLEHFELDNLQSLCLNIMGTLHIE
jgi:hypothetical protein